MRGARARLLGAAQAALAVSIPYGIVVLVLAAFGRLPLDWGLLAWALGAAGAGAVLWPLVQGLARVVLYLEAVVEGGAAGAPSFAWLGLGRALSAAMRHLDAGWRSQSRALADSLAARRTLLDALPDPLLLLSRERRVVFANAAARAMIGADPQGRDLAEVLRVPGVLAAAERVWGGEAASEVSFQTGPEPRRHYIGRLQALRAPPPQDSAVALVLHDVTALERGQRQRADFVANASHEIRTPLAAIVGAIETVQGPARDDAEARARFLAMIAEHAERITRLVDDLLSLSRIEMAEHEPPAGAVALAPVLDQARTALDWRARAREVAIVLDLSPGLPEVQGDADELRQLFQNLIDNAIKYGNPNAEVTVSARPVAEGTRVDSWRAAPGAVAVTVADRGPGIAPEHLPRLTERFYRVDRGRSRQMGGTGLGLAIVKHIVNRHRGALQVTSELGVGSRFTVCLNGAPEGE